MHMRYNYQHHPQLTHPVVDLTPLYPPSIHTALPFLNHLRAWYINRHADPLFIDPPAWFALYTWMEALYHLPLSIWAVNVLIAGRYAPPVFALLSM